MKARLILVLIFGLQSCNTSIKKGDILIIESNEEPDKKMVNEIPAIYLRLRDGFEKDSIQVCYEDCFGHDKITTDKSLGFARSIALNVTTKKTKQITFKMRNKYYIIPIKRGYLFIDISNENYNLLKIRYSNKILTLS